MLENLDKFSAPVPKIKLSYRVWGAIKTFMTIRWNHLRMAQKVLD
jgi:hypothetical protein